MTQTSSLGFVLAQHRLALKNSKCGEKSEYFSSLSPKEEVFFFPLKRVSGAVDDQLFHRVCVCVCVCVCE